MSGSGVPLAGRGPARDCALRTTLSVFVSMRWMVWTSSESRLQRGPFSLAGYVGTANALG
eukprot:9739823-Alexandrium_andersonii.AAC.1